MSENLKAINIEEAVYRNFNIRQNVVVPNVYWGLGLNHECDVFVCSMKSRYCTEVEIKVSKADILKDKKKKKWEINLFATKDYYDERIKRLFFAVPKHLEEYALEHIPSFAGLLVVGYIPNSEKTFISRVRSPKNLKGTRPLTQDEFLKLTMLGCMRLHKMTKQIIKANQ